MRGRAGCAPGAAKPLRWEWACLFLILAWFLSAAAWGVMRLGMHYDEAIAGLDAWGLIEQLRTLPLAAVHFPLMESNCYYLGSTEAYLLVPFFWLWGPGIGATRLVPVLFGAGSLLCLYGVVRRWFGARPALLSAGLLAINPCFIFSMRLGLSRDEFLQIFFFWLFLLLVTGDRRRWELNLAAFVFGLALWAKMMWVGYAGGLLVAGLLFGRLGLRRWLLDVRNLGLSLLLGLAGCFPLIVFNALHGWVTPVRMWEALFKPVNRGLLENAGLRAGQVWEVFRGMCPGVDQVLRGTNWVSPLLVCLSLAALGVMALERRCAYPRRPFAFLAVVFGVLFLLAGFTPSSHEALHMINLLPFGAVAVAVAACAAAARVGRPWAAAVVLLVAVHAGMEVRMYAQALAQVYSGRVNIFMNADIQHQLIDAVRPYARGGVPVSVYEPLFSPVVTFVSGKTLATQPDWDEYTADALCGNNFDRYRSRFYERCLRDFPSVYFVGIYQRTGDCFDWFLDRLAKDRRPVIRLKTLADPAGAWQCVLVSVGPADLPGSSGT